MTNPDPVGIGILMLLSFVTGAVVAGWTAWAFSGGVA